MSRLLFIIIIVAVVFWLFKSYRKRLPMEDAPGKETPVHAEDMVRCVHCGVHLPKRESLLAGDKYYCSEAHRRIHADKPD